MTQVTTMRDGIATRIKDLTGKFAGNIIALGKEFARARDTFPVNNQNHRPGWHNWIRQNTEWTTDHATKFVQIHERMSSIAISSTTLGVEVLKYLTMERIPDEAVKAVVSRANEGEAVSLNEAKDIVKAHLPTPAQAMKEARATGKLIHARDGHIYSGATEDEMMAHSERRHVVYGMKDAIKHVADCQLTPHQWIKSIGDNDHWISEFKIRDLDAAIKYLTALRPLVAKRQEDIDGTR